MTMLSGWLCARCPRTIGMCSVNARSKSHPDNMVTGVRKKGKLG